MTTQAEPLGVQRLETVGLGFAEHHKGKELSL